MLDRIQRGLLLPAAMLVGASVCGSARAVTVTQRDSTVSINLNIVAGLAGDTFEMEASTTALTGGLSFDQGDTVTVSEGPFSTGAATVTGALATTEHLSQPTAESIQYTATRNASVAAQYISGEHLGASGDAHQFVRFTFEVVGEDLPYSLTGFFDPGADNPDTIFDAGYITLNRPFTSFTAFTVDTAGPLNETGVLPAGSTYAFEMRVRDVVASSINLLSQSDASSLDIQFIVGTVPEPSTAVLLGIGILGVGLSRRWRTRGV